MSEAGVWVVYNRDMGVMVQSIHADELSALRVINMQGYGSVAFVGYGSDVSDL